MRFVFCTLYCYCVMCTPVLANTGLVENLETAQACKRTSLLYAHYADNGRLTDMPSLFTEDGSWETTTGLLQGRAAIEKAMAAAPPGGVVMRHVITNHLIFEDADGRLTGQAYFTLYRAAPDDANIKDQPVMLGAYKDVYRIEEGECLFVSRTSSATFK
jgi:hypothetical protein